MNLISKLMVWISKGKFFDWDKHVYIYNEVDNPDHIEKELKFSIFTEKHEYIIRAIERENGKNYLGCIVINRAPWPGEKHNRGNDLADGDLTLETWNNIMSDIISCELIDITKFKDKQNNCEDSCTLSDGGEE